MSSSTIDGALDALLTRQSIGVLGAVGPTAEQLDAILRAAVTVPDHGALRPWRLVVIEGNAREAFGDALAAAGREANPEITPETQDRLRRKAFVAPSLIAVAARITTSGGIPEWEQTASASCAGYAITLAAHQLGLGAMWKSSPFQRGAVLQALLDLAETDLILGWINIGQIPLDRPASRRPEIPLDPIARRIAHDGRTTAYTSPTA